MLSTKEGTMELEVEYIFRFGDGRELRFPILLDPVRIEQLGPHDEEPPHWTHLDFHRCNNCPLQSATTLLCPLAQALAQPVRMLGGVLSYDEVDVEVITPERHILNHTTAQSGISAMMGLIIATSGCPHMTFLKPMARFHLPFATETETIYRAATMYLLGQYFRQRDALTAELGFDGLVALYRNVEVVNRAMAERLRAASREDGTVNALILLDMYAKTLPLAVEETLQELRPLYTGYL